MNDDLRTELQLVIDAMHQAKTRLILKGDADSKHVARIVSQHMELIKSDVNSHWGVRIEESREVVHAD